MTGSNCPACGVPAGGNYCSQCGASLAKPVECVECGNEIPAGGRFCNMCGTPAGATAGGGERELSGSGVARPAAGSAADDGSKRRAGAGTAALPPDDDATSKGSSPSTLAAAGISLAVLLGVLFVVLPRLGEPDPMDRIPPPPAAAPFAGGAVGASPGVGDPSAIDLASMTPEEAATRLFNRVMTSVSQGDSAAARQFAPMAIDAYAMIPNPDLDSRYHVALLNLVNLDLPGARATAESMLTEVPDHLFGLYTAGQAEQGMGNGEVARTFYQRFLDAYDAEIALQRPEYVEHAAILPGMLDNARQSLGVR